MRWKLTRVLKIPTRRAFDPFFFSWGYLPEVTPKNIGAWCGPQMRGAKQC